MYILCITPGSPAKLIHLPFQYFTLVWRHVLQPPSAQLERHLRRLSFLAATNCLSLLKSSGSHPHHSHTGAAAVNVGAISRGNAIEATD